MQIHKKNGKRKKSKRREGKGKERTERENFRQERQILEWKEVKRLYLLDKDKNREEKKSQNLGIATYIHKREKEPK